MDPLGIPNCGDCVRDALHQLVDARSLGRKRKACFPPHSASDGDDRKGGFRRNVAKQSHVDRLWDHVRDRYAQRLQLSLPQSAVAACQGVLRHWGLVQGSSMEQHWRVPRRDLSIYGGARVFYAERSDPERHHFLLSAQSHSRDPRKLWHSARDILRVGDLTRTTLLRRTELGRDLRTIYRSAVDLPE